MHWTHTASIGALGAAMRAGRITSTGLVEAHIDRLRDVEDRLNAIAGGRFEEARAEAEQADQRMREGDDAPLLGIPCTIKEFVGVRGMPHTGGLTARAHAIADEDATVVARLRRAGAIVMAVTNVPEGGLWLESYNRIRGRTNNPIDPARTSGGSSGGEAAVIAAGASPFGIGSDMAGSIRIPAMFCGVPGHKPSGRLVPNTGHYPPPSNEAVSGFMVTGPLARRVDDLYRILSLIAGPDGRDAAVRPMPLHDPGRVDLRGVRVMALPRIGRVSIRPSIRGAVHRAMEAARAAGCPTRTIELPALRHAFRIWSDTLSDAAGNGDYAEVLGDGTPIPVGRELVKWTLRRSGHTAPALALVVLEKLLHRLPAPSRSYTELGVQLRAEMLEYLGNDGVIVQPTYSRPAPRHRGPYLTPFDFVCTALYNLFEFPATQVPVGVDPRGLPVGVQVVGAPGQDHLTLAVASAIEARSGGWIPPTG